MWRLESFLLAYELYDELRPQESGTWGSWRGGLRCEQKPKSTGEEADKSAVLLMLEAITAGSCNEDVNYQVRANKRLGWLDVYDCVLGFVMRVTV